MTSGVLLEFPHRPLGGMGLPGKSSLRIQVLDPNKSDLMAFRERLVLRHIFKDSVVDGHPDGIEDGRSTHQQVRIFSEFPN